MPAETEIDFLIPSHNGSATIEATLAALAENLESFPHLHAVVIPNACRDDTAEIAANFLDRLPLTIIPRQEGGKNKALNHAIERTNAPLVVTMDDDVHVSPHYARDLADLAARYPRAQFFSGPIRPKFPRSLTPVQQQMLTADMRAAIFAELDLGFSEAECEPHLFYGPAIAMRRDLFSQDHRFSENIGPTSSGSYAMGSETEFLSRMERQGAGGVYSEALGVDHLIEEAAMELTWMYGRAERSGRGMVRKEVLASGDLPNPRRRAFWHSRHAAALYAKAARLGLAGRQGEKLRQRWHAHEHWGAAKECLVAARSAKAVQP